MEASDGCDMDVARSVTILDVDEDDTDDIGSTEFFGYMKGNIVGLRYYDGLVNNREMVALEREPFNPYDSNAVRVNNILGQQVGHIKREIARALAEVVDQGLASIEGIVPYGSKNIYSMAVEISFWGKPENKARACRIMARYGYPLRTQEEVTGTGRGGSQQKIYSNPSGRTTRLSPDQMRNELDGLFEKLKDIDQTEEEKECAAIKSVLYPHQRQAVAWMKKRELSDGLPPFWEEKKPDAKTAAKAKGSPVYYNAITNHMTVFKPQSVKGGILADDMGLGKTLVTISLIFGNSWNGKPIHNAETGESITGINESSETKPCDESFNSKNVVETIDLTGNDVENVTDNDNDKKPVPVDSGDNEGQQSKSKSSENVVDQIMIDDAEDSKPVDKEPPKHESRRSKRATKRPARYIDDEEIVEEEVVDVVKPKKSARQKKAKTKPTTEVNEDYIPTQDATISSTKESNLKADLKFDVEKTKTGPSFVREHIPDGKPHTTLIVCPLSLISNWVDQVAEHAHPSADVKIFVFHGPAKSQATGKLLKEQDIVITTYQTLAQEMKRSKSTLLFQTNWLRIVLDEGHIIRNPKAKMSIACKLLRSERKWVLTGTPIQNSTKDLFSIISFFAIDPFTNQGWWQRTIERPINDGDKNALKWIRCLLSAICMRRTKQQKVNGKPIINMPKKEIFLHSIDLSVKERELYNKVNAACKKMMMKYISDGSEPTRFSDMLVYIMRLRQICCHPSLVKDAIGALCSGSEMTEREEELAMKLLCMIESGNLDECCICLDSPTSPVIIRCSHVFCKLCITGVISNDMEQDMSPRCPLCRRAVRDEDLVEPPIENESDVTAGVETSSKINALMNQLLTLRKEEPKVKSLVVSQYTEYLKIIQNHLVGSDIPCVLYHGGMTRTARENAISQLQFGQASVMLMSLKAGGVGLNLTAASRVFLMEPSWNPAAEDQCFDRVYRLGQNKPVKIVKFICNGTVEERMMEMQSRKRELAKASLQRRTAEERKKQKRDEIGFLVEL